MVTLTDIIIQVIEIKPLITYFVNSGFSVSSILLPNALTICLSSILSIYTTKAIAFVVDFSIQ